MQTTENTRHLESDHRLPGGIDMNVNHSIKLFMENTPPKLERVFGYRGTRQWVTFFWGKKIDNHIMCYGFDGIAFNPVSHLAWDSFFSHELVVAMNHERDSGKSVKRFEFGDEYLTSDHWLLLDRWERLLYAARKDSVLYLLKTANDLADQKHTHENADPTYKGPDDLDLLDRNGALEMVVEMLEWLDKQKERMIREGRWPIL
jgi:hypothetical protein